jgi:hypothetical protein
MVSTQTVILGPVQAALATGTNSGGGQTATSHRGLLL